MNCTAYVLGELCGRTSFEFVSIVQNIENLIHVRNCVVHSAGLEAHYERRNELPASIDHLDGLKLKNAHFLGRHIWIEKNCLRKYIIEFRDLAVTLHERLHEKGFLKNA